ncbi:hypothetical protein KR222_002869 [Zaprionus bogoriensis]|nr:hypothetical protein KR222_002869 [Zaprionus bogoriensis]
MQTSGVYLTITSSVLVLISQGSADVAHFFAAPSDFGSYLHGRAPFQVELSPIAPIAPSTIQLAIPEVIDNQRPFVRHGNFIPLRQHYLEPAPDERPIYESPKPDKEVWENYYSPPSISSTTTIATTKATLPPIVVQEFDDNEARPGYTYDAHHPSTPAPVYLPSVKSNQEEQQLRLRLKDMRCLHNGYFRAVLKLESFIGAAPVVDNHFGDDANKYCELKFSRNFLLVDISDAHFESCGVSACGQDLCLRLRFPAIRGLRTSDDTILTLHCKVQEKVAAKTHAFKMAVSSNDQARSTGRHAHGGNQIPFRTHVELLTRRPDGLMHQLGNGSEVQLGEELMLRAHVLTGDEWNFTKISDVQLQRISSTGEVMHSAQLITSRGCLNPAMQSICALAPLAEPPLGQRLLFRAVMFPGMHSGDVLLMSVRITGCLEREDCQQMPQDCLPSVTQRKRRDAGMKPYGNETEASELSQLTFKVIVPSIEEKRDLTATRNMFDGSFAEVPRSLKLVVSLGLVVLLICVAIITQYTFRK